MRQFVLLLLLCAGSFSMAGAATAPPVAAEHPMQAAYAKLLIMKPAASGDAILFIWLLAVILLAAIIYTWK